MQGLIRKAIFPVAGLGTRFLPATKASPKEMLPIVDKPLIQYAVEEAIHSGIEELIFVTSSNKRAIEDHFDKNFELEHTLLQRQKTELLKATRDLLPPHVNCIYVRQKEARGLGDAILCAKSLIGDEAFAILLADDLIQSDVPCLKQMVSQYEATLSGVIAVETIAREKTDQYGIVQINTHNMIERIVEKPKPASAPSNLGVVGRYILSSKIFKHLESTTCGQNGEIQLTDAIAKLLSEEALYALPFSGKRFDCGNKLGYLEATLEFALAHPQYGKRCDAYLKRRFSKL